MARSVEVCIEVGFDLRAGVVCVHVQLGEAMAEPDPRTSPGAVEHLDGDQPVGGPVTRAWQESTLTRAKELAALSAWVVAGQAGPEEPLRSALDRHLEAARQAARGTRP